MTYLMDFWAWLAQDDFHKEFVSSFRTPFFTAFITASSFLLSAHTFIVIHMKRELYDLDEYKTRFDDRKALMRQGCGIYDPLRGLSRLLFASTACCLFASICQITVGVAFPYNWSATFCSLAATIAVFSVGGSVWVMWTNLSMWYDLIAKMGHPKDRKTKCPEDRKTKCPESNSNVTETADVAEKAADPSAKSSPKVRDTDGPESNSNMTGAADGEFAAGKTADPSSKSPPGGRGKGKRTP